MTFHKTRFRGTDTDRLVYAKVGDRSGDWSFYVSPGIVHADLPDRIGPLYASKAELLSDLNRVAEVWGFSE